MILRLLLFFLFYGCIAAGVGAVVFYGGRRLLRGPLERRRHHVLGRRNAKLLTAKEEEKCFVCLESVDPSVDAFEDNKGWYHARCYETLLK